MYKPIIYELGYTLMELMVTISIAGILLTIAIPNFTSIISSNRLTTYANELVIALNFARSEAIRRGQLVMVMRKSATDSEWERGWDLFVDNDANRVFNDDGDAILCEVTEDCLLRTYDVLPDSYTLRSGSSYACWVVYTVNGLSKGSGPSPACNGGFASDTFRLCNGTDKTTSRAITINAVGRIRVSTGTVSCP
jgi:type IV fimbrial biogenesis protein FimT